MKKVAIGILSVLLAVAIALFLFCVYFTITSFSFVGEYKFKSMRIDMGNDQFVMVEAGKEVEVYEGVVVKYDKNDMVLSVKKDNTWELTTKTNSKNEDGSEAEPAKQTGTWEKADGKYYLISGEEKKEITVSIWKVSMENDVSTIVLEK